MPPNPGKPLLSLSRVKLFDVSGGWFFASKDTGTSDLLFLIIPTSTRHEPKFSSVVT